MTSERPKSSIAQMFTAVATGGILVSLFVIAGWWLTVLGDATQLAVDGLARPVSQAACLTYSDFVLDQHRAGLTPNQIRGLLANADREARPGRTPREGSVVLDDEIVCGSVDAVIAASR